MPEFHLRFAAEDRGVAAELQAALVDLVDLAVIGKQAHWHIAGPHFRWAHFELDEPPTRRAGTRARVDSETWAPGPRPAGSGGNANPRSVPDER